MKTLQKIVLTTKYVEFVPNDLEQNVLYISKEFETIVHLCLCGCGNLSVTPINERGWKLIESNNKVSLTPSILNTACPNRYHYIITNNIANVC